MITTASAANVDYVRGLGADRVVDYNAEDFTKVVSDCDVVFDTVGGDVQARSYSVLKPGGRLVWVAPAPDGSRRRDRMSRYCARLSAATARTWSGSWRCWTLARSRRRPSRATISRMPPKLTVSAKPVTCGASWFSPFAERFERPSFQQSDELVRGLGSACHCERSEAIPIMLRTAMEIAASLHSSQ